MEKKEKAAVIYSNRLCKTALIVGCLAIIMVITASAAYSMAKQVEIVDNGDSRKVATFANTVSEVLSANKINLDEKDEVTPSLDQQITDGMQIIITRAKNIIVEYEGNLQNIKNGKTND